MKKKVRIKIEKYNKDKNSNIKRELLKDKEETMIRDYLQDRFNDKYLGSMTLLGFVVCIIGAFWVVHGSTFGDGIMRFLAFIGMIIIIHTLLKGYLMNRIKREAGI